MKTSWINPKCSSNATTGNTNATTSATGGNTGGNAGGKPSNGGKPDLKCLPCKQSGHGNVVFCESLKDFLPQGNDVKKFPKVLCTICLSTFKGNCKDCKHPKNNKKYLSRVCKGYNLCYILCKYCPKHSMVQSWWKAQHVPGKGYQNYVNIENTLGKNALQVNAVFVSSIVKDSAAGGIEEMTSSVLEECLDNACVFNTVMNDPILVNDCEIGSIALPTELVRVSYNGTECFIQLFYDEGSQITLVNPQCATSCVVKGYLRDPSEQVQY